MNRIDAPAKPEHSDIASACVAVGPKVHLVRKEEVDLRSNRYAGNGRTAPGLRNSRCRRGLSLIEALLALAITSTLLIALCAAFQASASVVQANDAHFRCAQAARLALGQITTEIRRAEAVQIDPDGGRIQIIRPADLLAANEIYRQFCYDPSQKRVTLQIFYAKATSSPLYELADHVTGCTFGPAETRADDGGATSPGCIPISITCSIDGTAVTLSGSTSPRRAYNHGQ